MVNFITMSDVDRTVLNIDVATKVGRIGPDELYIYYGRYAEYLPYRNKSERDADYNRIIDGE